MKMHQSKRNKLDQFVGLPREILIDILSRLPTRTVINCMVVCKAWRDAIECVEFTRLRLSKPDPDPYPYLIIPAYPIHKIIELNGRSPLLIREVVEFSLPRDVGVRGTVNGLILHGEPGHLFVCNPITREFIKLPHQHHRPHSSFNWRNSYGFGVSRTSCQYKVVWIFQYGDGNFTRSVCQVYTLGTKKWRTIAVGALPPLRHPTLEYSGNKWNTTCAFAGGNLYWLESTQSQVYCFDLETEAFAYFATPPASIGHGYYYRSLSVLDDCLSLYNVICPRDWSRRVEVEIWLMRGGGDWTSKKYLINIKDAYCTSIYNTFPIRLLEDGGMLLGASNGVGLYAKKGDEEGEGHSLLNPECCCEYVFDNASVCNLSFLSLKTLFAGEDVKDLSTQNLVREEY